MIETIVFVLVGMFLFTSPILGYFVENYLRDDDEEIILEEDTGKVDAPLWGNNLPHGAVPNGVLFYPIWGTMLTVTLFMFMVTLFLLTVTVVSMFRTSHHGYV